ncbi:MAG: methylated-DNA--[protein]-cysteine S-methyltransferase [Candidatus Kariarchaeaceae archaeon]|jgi:AraC family transcriptional regulator of adaptative response/methylated-DNA-[protein]-cysteine methyltransferase
MASNKNPLHNEIELQITQYLEGKLIDFEIPLLLTGTDFQKKVWMQLLEIPYGETISYGDLAQSIGNKKAMRAVGAANGANSIAIIIPCHRVIRADGHLQGYGGGLWRKKKLIEIEKNVISKSHQKNLDEWLE